MKAEDLKKIAKIIYPNETVEIEDDEVWLVNYPSTTTDNSGRKVLVTRFNPKEDAYQLADCEERVLEKEYILMCGKTRDNTYFFELNRAANENIRGVSKTKADALLNAILKVIEND